MIYNREQAERAAQRRGSFFFAKESMRLFSSRIGKFYPVPGGAFFVTSERDGSRPRRYTIRFISDLGTTSTRYGYRCGYQRFISSTGANRIAKRLQQIAVAISD